MSRNRGLAIYIGAGSLYLILLPLTLMGIWCTWIFNTAIRRSIASSNDLSARAVSSRLEEFLGRQGQVLDRIESMLLRTDLYPRSKMNDYISTSLTIYPFLDWIEILDPEGRIAWMAPFDEALIGVSRVGEAVYESVKVSKGIAWSPSYISLKHNAPAVTFGRRVGDHVVLCDLDLASILRFSTPAEPGAGFEISVTDANGVLLYNPAVSKIQRREQQSGFADIRRQAERGGSFEVEIEGRGLLVSVSRVLDPALFVIISYRASRVAETLRGYSLGFSAIPILSAAIGFMISRYRARKIERALAQLAIRAVRISGGQYDELVEFGEGFVEFQRVGEKFNGLSRNAEMPCSSSGRSQPTMTRPGW